MKKQISGLVPFTVPKGSEWIDPLLKEIAVASDSVKAIIGATFLDVGLRQVLEAGFPNLRALNLCDRRQLLETFGSKVDIARAIDVITDDEHNLLETIRNVRNEFAHPDGFGMSFDNPSKRLLKATAGLVVPVDTMVRAGLVNTEGDFGSLDHRTRFIHAVITLTMLFQRIQSRMEAGLDFRNLEQV